MSRPLRALILCAALCAAGVAAAAPSEPPAWAAKLDPFLRRVALGTRRVEGRFVRHLAPRSPETLQTLPSFVRRDRAAGPEGALFVKAGIAPGARAAAPADLARRLRDLGVEVRGRVGDVAALRVPPGALEALARLPEISWIRASRAYRPLNEIGTGSGQIASDGVNAAPFGITGRGVIVAVVDTGIQWTDRDFRNADGTSRILGIWDQTLTDPAHPPPSGFTFGAWYPKAEIDAALAGGPALLTGDGHGHGTHVAGSAAGNGLETGNGVAAGTFAGAAPEADLLIVRVFDNAGLFCEACDLTAAVQLIEEVADAAGMPWVGNMSLGTNLGAHDGTDPDELTIDAAVGLGTRGSQMAIAAGNSAADRSHWQGTLASAGSVVSNTFTMPSATRAGADNDFVWLDLWYEGGDSATVEVVSPRGFTVSAAKGVDTGIVCATDGSLNDGAVEIFASNAGDALNGDNQVFVQISDSSGCGGAVPRSGAWTIRVRADAVGPAGAFHLWNESDMNGIAHVAMQNFTVEHSVGVPGTARHALTAAAHVNKCTWTDVGGTVRNICASTPAGAIASFSSAGPTRDGRMKPDVSAPGQIVGSSLAGTIESTRGTSFTERDGRHGIISGTSMATPHLAGTAALLLALKPALQGTEVRAAILRAARGDAFTGALPNNRFGAGKLRAFEAASCAASLVVDLAASGAGGGFAATDTPLVDEWNVYRVPIPGLSASNYGACFLNGIAAPSFADAALPPPGQAFGYLAVGVRGGVEGILGVDSAGRTRPNGAPCP